MTRDIGQAIAHEAHHLDVDRTDAFVVPSLKRALDDLPTFGQLGLGKGIVCSHHDS